MKIETALEIEQADNKERMTIRMKKANDYAKKNGDCLSNFKVMADIEQALQNHGYSIPIDKSYGVAFWHLLHKLVRLLNLFNEGVTPENEPLRDTFLDANNYIDLCKECYMDE